MEKKYNLKDIADINILIICTLSLIIILGLQLSQPLIIQYLKLFEYLDFSSIVVKIITLILTLLLMLNIIRKSLHYEQLDNNAIKWTFITLSIYTFYRVSHHPDWAFVNIFSNGIKYFDIIYIITLLYMVLGIQILNKKKKNNQISDSFFAYSDVAISSKEDDKFNYNNSANDLLNRIIENPIYYKDRALCIGISSQWGSGKTSFLNLMQSSVEEDTNSDNYQKAVIIKFSPWLCNSSVQITKDFMTVFSSVLLKFNPNIKSELSNYSRVLANAELGWFSKILKLSVKEDAFSIENQFNKLSQSTSLISKPIIVFIDDIDRLKSDEILSVIQLIRNTANFKNTVFIVTFDKDYVLGEIGKEISKADEYLEKIFTTQYFLPIIQKENKSVYTLELMKNALLASKEESKYIEQFLNDIEDDISIRNIKRFLNQLIIAKNQIQSLGLDDLFIYDFLLIEYLHFKYHEFYDTLPNLESGKPLTEHNQIVALSKTILEKPYPEEEYCNKYIKPLIREAASVKDAHKILKLIFEENNNLIRKQYLNAYRLNNSVLFNMYFKRQKNERIVSQKEFNDVLLLSNMKQKEVFSDWLKNKDRKLIIRLIENIVFSSKSEGIKILNLFIDLIPNSYKEIEEHYTRGEKALFIAGGNYLNHLQDVSSDYRYLYLETLSDFFKSYESDNLSTINKKFFLLNWYHDYTPEIFQNDQRERDHWKIHFGEMYISYLERYLLYEPNFNSFELFYIYNLENITSENKAKSRDLLKAYIGKHLKNFVEQITDFNQFADRFGLKYIFSKPIDNYNDDSTNWIQLYKTFLDSQPEKNKSEEWFIKHRKEIG